MHEAGLVRVVGPRLPLAVPVPLAADAQAGVSPIGVFQDRRSWAAARRAGGGARLRQFVRLGAQDDMVEVPDLGSEDAESHRWLDASTAHRSTSTCRGLRSRARRPSRVVGHGDLWAEHVLVQDGRLTGIICWPDDASCDPALDVAKLYRDFGPGARRSAQRLRRP